MLLEPVAGATVTFDPLVEEWFASKFGAPTAPQIAGWPQIQSGKDVLISAPTGSGKTLAAFLVAVDRLLRDARRVLSDSTHVLYVSPLKALVNDVHANLEQPLAEINDLAAQRKVTLAPITVALRTGDTPVPERARMLKVAPHILVTTPESLFILLTAQRSRELLRSVSTVSVSRELKTCISPRMRP